jgi:hypothetical protein
MTPAERYRAKAAELSALAKAESDPLGKSEYYMLAQSYARLADQAERNSRTDVVYETPSSPRASSGQSQSQSQQQQQPQPNQKGSTGE